MARVAYVNGRYCPHNQATIHIEDRGLQFADSVYEVAYVYKGQLIDAIPHLDRLSYSLGELEIPVPMKQRPLLLVIEEMIRRNNLSTGLIYIQVTRGTAPRDFPYPRQAKPNIMMTARAMAPFDPNQSLKGIKVMSLPDIRWLRRDIKTTALLAASMSKEKALSAGFDDAWLLDGNNLITEGTSNNAWIINQDGSLQTRPPSHDILNGITRRSIMTLAQKKNIPVIEKAFSLDEAYAAQAAFISSASACIKPIVQINDQKIADGQVPAIAQEIANLYHQFLESHCA